MKTIATALESYAVDHNQYPPNDWVHYTPATSAYSVIPRELSTPISYLSNYRLYDPFAVAPQISNPDADPEDAKLYTYHQILTLR